MILAGVALAALTALRLVMAAILPLAPDEAYYWIWSRALAPGYYDHPPMVALWIRAGTALAGETTLGVRLLGPFAAALGTVLLADAANRLVLGTRAGPVAGHRAGPVAGHRAGPVAGHRAGKIAGHRAGKIAGHRAGVIAGVLLNATLILGVGSVIMTPDAPLLLFWTATIWALARIARSDRPDTGWWLAAGLFGGLALASKYTAVFLGLGIVLWLVSVPSARRHLRRTGPWLGLVLALAIQIPILMWNADHDWAGFLRQGGRVTSWHPGRAVQFLGELIGGQAGLVTPGIWLLCVAGIGLALRRAWPERDPGWTLLALLTVPASLYFVWYALGARVQGNWPGIVYPAASIAAAGLLTAGFWRRLYAPAVGLGLGVTLLTYLQAATSAIPLPLAVDPIALRLADWDRVAAVVEAERQRTGAGFVAADQYALAAALAWVLPRATPVLGIEDRWRLFNLPKAEPPGMAGILVRDSRDRSVFDPRLWRSVRPLTAVTRADVQTVGLFLAVPVGAAEETERRDTPPGVPHEMTLGPPIGDLPFIVDLPRPAFGLR